MNTTTYNAKQLRKTLVALVSVALLIAASPVYSAPVRRDHGRVPVQLLRRLASTHAEHERLRSAELFVLISPPPSSSASRRARPPETLLPFSS